MEIERIRAALAEGDVQMAETLLQGHMAGLATYDDTTAILDAAVGSGLGDRERMWEAIRKGLSFNCRNYELYVMLGEYLLPEAPYQSWLCYENALFYCDDPKDRTAIEGALAVLEETHQIFVDKVMIVIWACSPLEYVKLCVKSIRMTTAAQTREILVVSDGRDEAYAKWAQEQDDVLYVEAKDAHGGLADPVRRFRTEGRDILFLADDAVLTANALFWLRMGAYDKEQNGAVGCVSNVSVDRQLADGVDDAADLFIFGEKTNIPWRYPYEERIYLSGFAVFVKGSVYDQTGGLDDKLGVYKYEDHGIRILEKGYRNVLCKNSFIVRLRSCAFQEMDGRYVSAMQDECRRLNEKWGCDIGYHLGARKDLPSLIDESGETPLHVLEIGCGCGALLGYIKGQYPNAEVYGVEIMEGAARIAAHMGEVLCGDIEKMELPWKTEYFDYVIMGDVLEHLMDPEAVLKKLRGHLKTGGHILASMPNMKHYTVLLPLLRWDLFPYADSGILDRTHVKMYTGTEIKHLILRSGYVLEKWGYHSYHSVCQPNEQEEKMLDILAGLMDEPSKEPFLAYQYVFMARK